MRRSLKDYIQESNEPISESLVGKGVAIANNRQHAANKSKLSSQLNLIQNDCRQGVQEADPNKKIEILFQIAYEFAGALKIFAEMSSNTNNVSTTGVLDTANIQKEITSALLKFQKK